MKTRTASVALALMAATVLAWFVSQSPSNADTIGGRLGLPLGREVVIHYRADAGSDRAILERGRLADVNDNWLVLNDESAKKQIWVARPSILKLEIQ